MSRTQVAAGRRISDFADYKQAIWSSGDGNEHDSTWLHGLHTWCGVPETGADARRRSDAPRLLWPVPRRVAVCARSRGERRTDREESPCPLSPDARRR